jgi:ATP-dependent helicase/nuclease subunit A
MSDLFLPFDDPEPPRSAPIEPSASATITAVSTPLADEEARVSAVDPTRNVVLEASAGTGKTRVLVDRYVNVLRAGVDPDHILAITFTRKAAAEMRDRIIGRLREASRHSHLDLVLWRNLKDRLADISISTIDAFCLSLLREFPLEADVDPGFEIADETEAPRLMADSLDQGLRVCREIAREDADVALVFAQLGERRLRTGLELLLHRRLVAPQALRRFLTRGPRDLTAELACRHAAQAVAELFGSLPDGLDRFLDSGPTRQQSFHMLATDLRSLVNHPDADLSTIQGQAAFRVLLDRLRAYFLTQTGKPREKSFGGTGFKAADCVSDVAWRQHRQRAAELSPQVANVIQRFRRDLSGVWRIFAIVLRHYEETLDAHQLLDFSGVLERAVKLLRELDEFAESRFRVEARYRHVLVDEFQDTSRAQWELIAQLVRTWGEGSGAGSDALQPSIFIVADRKQSIYAFRDAEVGILDEAAAFIGGLRAAENPRRAISVSLRAAAPLQAFVNDLFTAIVGAESSQRDDAFVYRDQDRFPIAEHSAGEGESPVSPVSTVGLIVGEGVAEAADRVSAEVSRLLEGATIRDRLTGIQRPIQPADVAILFRTRDSHREYERALAKRGILTYVYKGLGFFEADEVQDVMSLLRYLADPLSDLRAAAWLRSRFIRLSDRALLALAPNLAVALTGPEPPAAFDTLGAEDRRVLSTAREALRRWRPLVDRMTVSELLSTVLVDTAYAFETRGSRRRQARENLKKLRAMIRRFESRGYATLARVADHLDELAVGDEANAAIDARDAVSLMTVHAAKGLEFPVVFVVNMSRGTGTMRPPIRVVVGATGDPSVAIADYQSEADEEAQAREREETKRLLYVALTRARDRLYLSTALTRGACRMGRGSLGEVLPGSIRQALEEAGRIGSGSV